MLPVVQQTYARMPEPKWVIALGACACAAAQSPALPGNYHDTYALVGDLAHLVRVDVYVPGCPPRPEALTQGLMRVQELAMRERGWLRRNFLGGRPKREPIYISA